MLPGLNKPPVLPPRGLLCCLIGPPGTGKSSWAAEWPSPEAVIDPRDEGLIDLAYEGLIPLSLDQIHRATDVDSYVRHLQNCIASPCRTIICESILGIQALCYTSSSKNEYDGDLSHKKFLNYQNGPITASEKYFQKILDLMLLAQNKGKHVILIGHTVRKDVPNLEGPDYMAMVLGSDKQMMLRITSTFTNVFVIGQEMVMPEGGVNGKLKAQSSYKNWLFCHANPKYPSKNRMGIKSEFLFPSNAKEAVAKFAEISNRNPKTMYRRS